MSSFGMGTCSVRYLESANFGESVPRTISIKGHSLFSFYLFLSDYPLHIPAQWSEESPTRSKPSRIKIPYAPDKTFIDTLISLLATHPKILRVYYLTPQFAYGLRNLHGSSTGAGGPVCGFWSNQEFGVPPSLFACLPLSAVTSAALYVSCSAPHDS